MAQVQPLLLEPLPVVPGQGEGLTLPAMKVNRTTPIAKPDMVINSFYVFQNISSDQGNHLHIELRPLCPPSNQSTAIADIFTLNMFCLQYKQLLLSIIV